MTLPSFRILLRSFGYRIYSETVWAKPFAFGLLTFNEINNKLSYLYSDNNSVSIWASREVDFKSKIDDEASYYFGGLEIEVYDPLYHSKPFNFDTTEKDNIINVLKREQEARCVL